MVTESMPQRISFFNWCHIRPSDAKEKVNYLEPSERNKLLVNNEITSLKY